jgi:CubicO group peptidase (beta-lactamase class C family)
MEVCFFFSDDDPRIMRLPGMYSPVLSQDGGYTMVPCQETVQNSTNHTDHFAGPRACESLDTGLCMSVHSYAKFFDVLLNKGRTPAGKQVLDEAAVHTLTHDQTPLGAFSHGWKVRPCHVTSPAGTRITTVCSWSGYASTTAYLFPDEGAYVILGQQIMSYTPARDVVKNLLTKQVGNILRAMLGDVTL